MTSEEAKLRQDILDRPNEKWLWLGNGKLKQLPPEIGQLNDLELLDLSENLLIQLPPEIGQLRNLRFLALAGNKLTQVPSEIGHLWNNLQQLDLIPALYKAA